MPDSTGYLQSLIRGSDGGTGCRRNIVDAVQSSRPTTAAAAVVCGGVLGLMKWDSSSPLEMKVQKSMFVWATTVVKRMPFSVDGNS